MSNNVSKWSADVFTLCWSEWQPNTKPIWSPRTTVQLSESCYRLKPRACKKLAVSRQQHTHPHSIATHTQHTHTLWNGRRTKPWSLTTFEIILSAAYFSKSILLVSLPLCSQQTGESSVSRVKLSKNQEYADLQTPKENNTSASPWGLCTTTELVQFNKSLTCAWRDTSLYLCVSLAVHWRGGRKNIHMHFIHALLAKAYLQSLQSSESFLSNSQRLWTVTALNVNRLIFLSKWSSMTQTTQKEVLFRLELFTLEGTVWAVVFI